MIKAKVKSCKFCNKTGTKLIGGGCYPNCETPTKEIDKKAEKKDNNGKSLEVLAFGIVWRERKHECAGCGKKLFQPIATYFAHTIPKKWTEEHPKYRHFRHLPANITLKCEDCHHIQDKDGIQKQKSLLDYQDRLIWIKENCPEYYAHLEKQGHG